MYLFYETIWMIYIRHQAKYIRSHSNYKFMALKPATALPCVFVHLLRWTQVKLSKMLSTHVLIVCWTWNACKWENNDKRIGESIEFPQQFRFSAMCCCSFQFLFLRQRSPKCHRVSCGVLGNKFSLSDLRFALFDVFEHVVRR